MRIFSRLVFTVAMFSALSAQSVDAPSAIGNELRQYTQQLLDAVAPGHADVWRRLLHERMVHVDENGIVRNKAELLAELKPLPAGLSGTLRIAAFHLQTHGNVAVATHEDHEFLEYFGQPLNSRFRTTDTWLRMPAGWRLIGTQVLAIPEDPPVIGLDRTRLCAHAGVFALTSELTTTIRCEDGELVAERTGRPPATFRPETDSVFFSPGQPRTRRIFQRDAFGTVTGFVDRREGHDIRWRRVQ